SYRPFRSSEPLYSMPPLIDRTLRRPHVASRSTTAPLTVLMSTDRALRPSACTLPLMLDADRSPSDDTPDRSTVPETVFANSTRGAPVVVTLPLMLWTRTLPLTPVTRTLPEIDLRSTDAPSGTTTV